MPGLGLARLATAHALVLGLVFLVLLASAARVAASPAPAPRETAAQALVRYLEQEGVTKVFGVPGEETLDLIDALRRPEGKTLEFKRDLSAPDGFLKTVVAFANTAGGTILVGVEDGTQ